MGDNAEYQALGAIDSDALETAAAYLKEAGIQLDDMRQRVAGIEAANYSHCNYISLFWGEDDQPEMIRDLSLQEFRNLQFFMNSS